MRSPDAWVAWEKHMPVLDERDALRKELAEARAQLDAAVRRGDDAYAQIDVIREDIRSFGLVLGFEDIARPISPQQFFRQCIEEVKRLKLKLEQDRGRNHWLAAELADAGLKLQRVRNALAPKDGGA